MKATANILIVDDETNIRLMLRTALTSVGYGVSEATNGREAIDAVQASVQHIDVMILDLSMPVLDGMGVLRELQKVPAEKRPRVVVLTAYGSIPAAVKAMQLGASDFLEKPVSPDEVRESVEAVMTEPLREPFSGGTAAAAISGGFEGAMGAIRVALRSGNLAAAESLLMRAEDLGQDNASYFHLLGVYYEMKSRLHRARKFYGKAQNVDHKFNPPQNNLRRLYEMERFGRSELPILLGDETALDLLREQTAHNAGKARP